MSFWKKVRNLEAVLGGLLSGVLGAVPHLGCMWSAVPGSLHAVRKVPPMHHTMQYTFSGFTLRINDNWVLLPYCRNCFRSATAREGFSDDKEGLLRHPTLNEHLHVPDTPRLTYILHMIPDTPLWVVIGTISTHAQHHSTIPT